MGAPHDLAAAALHKTGGDLVGAAAQLFGLDGHLDIDKGGQEDSGDEGSLSLQQISQAQEYWEAKAVHPGAASPTAVLQAQQYWTAKAAAATPDGMSNGMSMAHFALLDFGTR